MRLPEERWGRGLENMPDEDALSMIFLLLTRMKDPRLLTHIAACVAVCLSTLVDKPIQEVFAALGNAVSDWTEEEVQERRAMVISTADQMEAGYAEFKARLYKEGIEPDGGV